MSFSKRWTLTGYLFWIWCGCDEIILQKPNSHSSYFLLFISIWFYWEVTEIKKKPPIHHSMDLITAYSSIGFLPLTRNFRVGRDRSNIFVSFCRHNDSILVKAYKSSENKYIQQQSLAHIVMNQNIMTNDLKKNDKYFFHDCTCQNHKNISRQVCMYPTFLKHSVFLFVDQLPHQGYTTNICLHYFPIAERGIVGFMPFPRELALSEMHTAPSSIWTLVTVCISYDNNR